MSEEALQTAEKRREAKGKGEKERYTHVNVEFQRIARRDKKAFLSDQCKKKKRKTIEWERLEISSRKLEIPREHFMQKVSLKVKVTQSCPTLCNHMDCIVHGILQARILE